MEPSLNSTEDVGRSPKAHHVPMHEWGSKREALAVRICDAYRSIETDLDRWFEGKFLKSTVFQ